MTVTCRMWLIATCLAIVLPAYAQTFYVSPAGDDGNDGRSEATAWRTIGKVNAEMGSMASATIAFASDEVHAGQLNVTANGVTVRSFGPGAPAVISGTRWIGGGWVDEGGNKWSRALPDGPERIQSLYEGERSLPLSRHPNSNDAERKGYFYYDKPKLDDRKRLVGIIDPDNLSSSKRWVGAEALVRYNRWRLVLKPVKAQNSNSITTDPVRRLYHPKNGMGYFFQNHPNALDQEGEWAHYGGKLYLFTTRNPNDRNFRYSSSQHAIKVEGASDVSIRGISVTGANHSAIHVLKSPNVSISDVEIRNTGLYGVRVVGSRNASLLRLNIHDTNFDGVRVEYDSPNALIANCQFRNIALTPGRGFDPDNLYENGDGYSAILIAGENGIVRDNRISRTGYCGLRVNMSSGMVRRNYIERVCNAKDDGGGIYVQDNLYDGDLFLEENVLRNISGNGSDVGTDRLGLADASEGIYLDTKAKGVTVRYNTVGEARLGIFVKGGKQTIHDNLVYNSLWFGLQLQEFGSVDSIYNLTVRDNLFVGSSTNGLFIMKTKLRKGTQQQAVNSWGTVKNNVFAYPDNQKPAIVRTLVNAGSYRNTPAEVNKLLSLCTGNRLYATPPEEDDELLLTNRGNSARAYPLPDGNVWHDPMTGDHSGSVTVEPWRSVVLYRTDRTPEAPPAGDVYDPMPANWSAPVANTGGWEFTSAPGAHFGGDMERRHRRANTVEAITYELDGVGDFALEDFTVTQTAYDGYVRFQVSSDGETYAPIAIATEVLSSQNGWQRRRHTPAGLLPSGTKYVRVVVGDGKVRDAWTPQLSSMSLSEGPQAEPAAPPTVALREGRWYYLENASLAGSRLDVDDCEGVALKPGGTSAGRQWRLASAPNGAYYLIARSCGGRLDVNDCSAVDVEPSGENVGRRWRIRPVAKAPGRYFIESVACGNRRLRRSSSRDVAVGSGVNVNHQWRFEDAGAVSSDELAARSDQGGRNPKFSDVPLVSAYPNPVTYDLRIEGEIAVDFQLITSRGEVAASSNGVPALQHEIPVDDLTSGVYVLRVVAGGVVSTQPIVVP